MAMASSSPSSSSSALGRPVSTSVSGALRVRLSTSFAACTARSAASIAPAALPPATTLLEVRMTGEPYELLYRGGPGVRCALFAGSTAGDASGEIAEGPGVALARDVARAPPRALPRPLLGGIVVGFLYGVRR